VSTADKQLICIICNGFLRLEISAKLLSANARRVLESWGHK